MGCNLRQRSIVRDLLTLWVPFVKMDAMYSALAFGAVCPVSTSFFALSPALTPTSFPLVIVVKIFLPPMVKRGAIFSPDMLSRRGVIRHLGLEGMCSPDDEGPCTCYHNGIEMNDQPSLISGADFISCYKGRSYTMVAEDVVSVSDADSIVTGSIVSIQDVGGTPSLHGCQPHDWAAGPHSSASTF